MKTTLAQAEAGLLPAVGSPPETSEMPAWEYCFLLQDGSNRETSELTQLAAAGWKVVSFRTRFDSQCEYLLKRLRK